MLAEYVGIKITDPELATKIMRIRDNTHYKIDGYCKFGEKVTEEKISEELDEEFDWMEALFDEGTADYVDINFFRRRDQIGTIVVSQSLPPRFHQNLKNLQEAYALGLFETTLVFCRSLIEVGVFEALKKSGKLRTTKNVTYMEHYILSGLMHQVRSQVKDLDNHDRAKEVIKKANKVLHWKKDVVFTVGEKDALEAVRTTFQLLEQLFGLESF